MTDLEPSSDWRTWSITVPSPASEQSVTSSPLQTSATLYSIFREIATPFLNFFSIFLRFFPFRLFFAVRSKSQLPLAFFGRPFCPFSRFLYPLIRAFLPLPQCPLARAFLFRFERYFHKLSPLAPPHFCLFCIIRSFMSVPSDLILFHPARRFTVLKQFSAFCQSSDVSLVIHHFSFSRAMRAHTIYRPDGRQQNQGAPSLRAWSLPPAAREAGRRNAEGLARRSRD